MKMKYFYPQKVLHIIKLTKINSPSFFQLVMITKNVNTNHKIQNAFPMPKYRVPKIKNSINN